MRGTAQMHDHGRPSFARLLAPLALIAFAVVVAAMVLGSGVVGDDDERQQRGHEQPAGGHRAHHHGRAKAKPRPATYTIKANDTLSGIAAAARHDGRAAPGAEPRARPAGARRRPEDQAARVRAARRTLAVAAVLAAAAAPAPAPRRALPSVPGAQAAIVVDARDGTVMFAKRPDSERAIASTTKLMTALLALERAKPERRLHRPRLQRRARRSRASTCARASG